MSTAKTPIKGGDGAREKAAREKNPLKRLFLTLGPGLITGASDDDPSGIGTYSIAGASLGYSTLWLALVTTPMQASVQYCCAKIGMVTGRGLSGVIRRHYPRALLLLVVVALLAANTLNVGADIGAIAAAIRLLLPVPILPTIIVISIVIVILQVIGSYRTIADIFKWLTLVLFAYIATAFFVHVDLAEALKSTFIPTFQPTRGFTATLVAILGTTISPYLFFWQASQEVEEEKRAGKTSVSQRRGASDVELNVAAIDINAGMCLSNLVMYFIILTCAATLHASGHTSISSATDAAKALVPFAGKFAEALLALGLIGTGLMSIPILTGAAAYALAEAMNWRHGLNEPYHKAKQFYAVIAVSTLLGMAMNFLGIQALQGLFWAAVINGLVAPPVLVLIMLISGNKQIMGVHVNGPITNFLGWSSAIAMFAAAIAMFLTGTSNK
jgi:NRAMP (natural resistance-associated macrophage protein)-like metal ion transporter